MIISIQQESQASGKIFEVETAEEDADEAAVGAAGSAVVTSSGRAVQASQRMNLYHCTVQTQDSSQTARVSSRQCSSTAVISTTHCSELLVCRNATEPEPRPTPCTGIRFLGSIQALWMATSYNGNSALTMLRTLLQWTFWAVLGSLAKHSVGRFKISPRTGGQSGSQISTSIGDVR